MWEQLAVFFVSQSQTVWYYAGLDVQLNFKLASIRCMRQPMETALQLTTCPASSLAGPRLGDV